MEAKLLLVFVDKDGGTNGDCDKPASWTYTVTAAICAHGKFHRGNVLATDVPVIKARPNGKMNPGLGVGWAFMSAGEIFLWDANETAATHAFQTADPEPWEE